MRSEWSPRVNCQEYVEQIRRITTILSTISLALNSLLLHSYSALIRLRPFLYNYIWFTTESHDKARGSLYSFASTPVCFSLYAARTRPHHQWPSMRQTWEDLLPPIHCAMVGIGGQQRKFRKCFGSAEAESLDGFD